MAVGAVLVLLLVSTGLAQDSRPLTLDSMRLTSGASVWLSRTDLLIDTFAAVGLHSELSAPMESINRMPLANRLSLIDASPLATYQSYASLDQRLGRAFNFTVAVANVKQPQLNPGGTRRVMSVGGIETIQESDGGLGDLWAVEVGLDMTSSRGHGIHLGYLRGTDPLTKEADEGMPEAQSLDLGYRYGLDGLYVNLGYVYTFGPDSTYRYSTPATDSTVYLRFQLKF